MAKRMMLILVIVLMCIAVAISGAVTFVNSNGILMTDKNKLPKKPPEDLFIFVDINENRMYLISKNNVLKTYMISSGKYSTPSPIGSWKIISKDFWGEGFGGYWMGFNVPWGKYGIHGTNEPYSIGGALSHGCIRMYNRDVRELFHFVKHGTKVIIYGGPFGPFGNGFRVIKPGDRGSDVYEVQRRLKELGYFNGYVNGIYGDATKTAIHNFQKKNKMQVSNYIGHSFYIKLGIYLFD